MTVFTELPEVMELGLLNDDQPITRPSLEGNGFVVVGAGRAIGRGHRMGPGVCGDAARIAAAVGVGDGGGEQITIDGDTALAGAAEAVPRNQSDYCSAGSFQTGISSPRSASQEITFSIQRVKSFFGSMVLRLNAISSINVPLV